MPGDEKNYGAAINNLNRDVEISGTEPIESLGEVESQASTIQPGIVFVPRSERRGLLGRFSVIPEITSPRDYGNGTKWAMTVIVSFAAITSSTGSSIFFPALAEVAHDLDTTPTVANLSLALYLLAMAFTPIWWSALSEKYGRRTIYLLSFSLFLVFSCISAVSVNITMLIVFRVLSGGAAASVQSVGAGTVADIWDPKMRGKAMGVFQLGPLCGPGLAPVIGGALTQGLGWRSTLWFLTIFGGVMLLLIFLCLPETSAKRERKPQTEGQKNTNIVVKVFMAIFGPFKALALLRFQPVVVVIWSGVIAFFAMYIMNVSLQAVFEKPPYNFTILEVGLVYLAPTIGYAISSIFGGRWIDYIMVREATKANRYDENGKLKYFPEDRMRENIWVALTLYPASLIWYGWTSEKGIQWAVPCVASIFFGLGMMLVMGTVQTALTEFTPKNASSGVAVANFVRNILACTGAVVTQPMIDGLGNGWMCTLIGLIAFVTGILAILSLRIWGPEWRVLMDQKLNASKS
ncbi:Major facilitator superfamily domain general substrate transporter [Penicillium cf. griseofulvum]|nr:Major facilitator superfamily domain general substrate transporter [Penicillium cf. griseofulvum]